MVVVTVLVLILCVCVCLCLLTLDAPPTRPESVLDEEDLLQQGTYVFGNFCCAAMG